MALLQELDPLAQFRRQMQQIRNPLALAQTSITDQLPQITPAEQESLLSELAGAAGSGLSAVATVLDTPGSVVRGLLSGEPGRAFGGIFDSGQRVSGRDMLETWGLLDQNTEGLDVGDVAGFLGEVFTDPLLPLTTGMKALRPAGEVAKRAGLLDNLAEVASAKLGHPVGPRVARSSVTVADLVKTPQSAKSLRDAALGMNLNPLDVLRSTEPIGGAVKYGPAVFSGPTAQKFGGALDTLGEAVRYSAPVRHLTAAFDPDLLGFTTKEGQLTAKAASQAKRRSIAEAREVVIKHAKELDDAGLMNPTEGRLLREMMEGTVPAAPHYQSTVNDVDSALADILQQEQEHGLGTQAYTNEAGIKYVPRQAYTFALGGGKGRKPLRALPTDHNMQLAREDILRNLPTESINRMTVDPVVSGPARQVGDDAAGAAYLQSVHGVQDPDHATKLANWLHGLDPQHAETKTPLFANHPLDDIELRITKGKEAVENAKAIFDYFKRTADRNAMDGVRVDKAIQGVGLLTKPATKQMLNRGIDPKNYFVPREVFADAKRLADTFKSPESVNYFIDKFDKATSMFKAAVLTWPGRYVRDLYSGQFANHIAGGLSYRSNAAADALLRREKAHIISGAGQMPAFRGMTDSAATKQLVIEAAKHGILHGRAIEDIPGAASNLIEKIPGQRQTSFVGALKTAIPKRPTNPGDPSVLQQLNPLNVRGVRSEKTVSSVFKAGEQIGSYTDGMNRLAPFIEYIWQGYDPATAAAKVKAAQVDYTALTKFERKVMRRILPFYSYLRGMTPFIMRELAERPGGPTAQTIRGANLSRQNEGFVPSWVGQGLAIPVGKNVDGTQRYLTGIDLPFEPVLGLLRPGLGVGDTLTKTGQGLLGNVNPYLKGPLELLANRQFYTGRELTELDSRLGRIAQATSGAEQPPDVPVLLDQILMNSPLSRVATTLGTLADPRKDALATGTNIFTGARLSDVNTDKAQFYAAREALEQLLKDAPQVRSFENLYVPQSALATLAPEHQRLYALYRGVQKESQTRAKQRRLAATQ